MKLAFKIMLTVMLVMAALLLIHGYLVVQREVNLFEEDMKLHAYLLGSVLATAVDDIYNSGGAHRVQEMIADANRAEKIVYVRWIRLDSPIKDTAAYPLTLNDLATLRQGKEVLILHHKINDSSYFHAYFPIMVDDQKLTALEITQPRAPMEAYIRDTILRKIILYMAFVLVGGLLVLMLGSSLVGKPVQIMVNLAHRVGEGDLSVRTSLNYHGNELDDLARGLDKMVEDLSESKKQLDEETARRIEIMEQLNRTERLATVGKLASGLAHELGTPLNVVSGRAKMISSEQMSTQEIINSAVIIKDQSDRMIRIIRQLLDFARSRHPQKSPVDALKLLENIITILTPIAEERKVSLNIKAGDRPVAINVDQDQIKQVFMNLIINAVQAMPDGGDIEISIDSEHTTPPSDIGQTEGEFARINVTDQGIGISEENLNRIFTPFFSTKEVGQGTGLGLSIVHGIVREHSGWITVESQVGKGSRFSVFLPLGNPT